MDLFDPWEYDATEAAVNRWESDLVSDPDEEYPRSDYHAYREWIGEGVRFLDRDDIPEHWQRFADDEIGTDLCGMDISTMTREDFDRL